MINRFVMMDSDGTQWLVNAIAESTGVADSGKPVITNADGLIDSSLISGSTLKLQCAVPISALRLISVDANGKAIYADNSSMNPVLGLSISAGNTNEIIEIMPDGIYTDPAWSWTANTPLFLIANGQ